jgi:hypothetical protein
MQTKHSNATIACNVSKDNINLIPKFDKYTIERDIKNRTNIIEKELIHLKTIANRFNLFNVWVVAELTGSYHKTLFRTAKRLKLHPTYVSTESVAKRLPKWEPCGTSIIK